MGATHFSGPVYSAGGFVGGGAGGAAGAGGPALSGGNSIFVDPESGPGDGSTPENSFQTIEEAIDAAGVGDTIYLAPGTYDENIVITANYVTLAGMVGGYGRPDIAPASGIAVVVEGQGVVLRGLRMVSADDHVCHVKGNGFRIEDCVMDGDGNGATDAGLLLQGDADDDSYTASEGLVVNCLFRNLGGYGILFKGAEPTVAVGSTHCYIVGCRFIDNTGADIATEDNAAGNATYSVQDVIIERCLFAEPKNKATWIDLTTSNGGAAGAQTGMIVDCFFNDDTVDTTAVKAVGTGFGFSGCHSLDGEIDGSGLD